MKTLWPLICLLLLTNSMTAAPAAFPSTPPGEFELKVLPAGKLLESTSSEGYFESSNTLFRPLFRYISDHGIAMTVPVEARINPGAMYFWVAPAEVGKVSGDRADVRVLDLPERTVAVHGVRGGYGARNFDRARQALEEWLAKQSGVVPTGDAYAVFWNGPFTPWFLKQFEVHIPVEKVGSSTD